MLISHRESRLKCCVFLCYSFLNARRTATARDSMTAELKIHRLFVY
uniref:Uncharacterized protein n=1 Tax=Arundo donax TaxID=35708 RepID=A0A0A9A6W9_ARUDO